MKSKRIRNIVVLGLLANFLLIILVYYIDFGTEEFVKIEYAREIINEEPTEEPTEENTVMKKTFDFENRPETLPGEPYFFPKRRYMPHPQFDNSNEVFGFHFGPHDPETGLWHDEPLKHDEEEIDCDRHNEKYLELMYRMGVLANIEERQQKYDLTEPEIEFLRNMNRHYLHYYNALYIHTCKEHYNRRERRNRIKTNVKWKEGDPVIVHRKRYNEAWNAYNPIMYHNCTVKFRVTGRGEGAHGSHLRITNIFKPSFGDSNLGKEKTSKEKNSAESVKDYYNVFYSAESTSQMTEELYVLAFQNYDFIFSYHPWSEIPFYIDYDNYYYFVQMNHSNEAPLVTIRELAGYGVDEKLTYDELRQQTIDWINEHHDHTRPVSAHISHCNDHNHKNQPGLDHMRNTIIDYLHKNGIFVTNYGVCKNFGSRIEEKIDPAHGYQYKVGHNNHYPFNIAMDNREVDGYSSEKLMQGMLSKYSVVIYFGEPFVKQRFPLDLLANYKVFIDVRDFDSPMHLVKYLKYLLANQTAYLEYFEWRWQKVYGKEGMPRTQTHVLHDYFDGRGKNTIPYCRIAERFVKERLTFYPEQSGRQKVVQVVEEKEDGGDDGE